MIKCDDFTKSLEELLGNHCEEITEGIKKVTDTCAKEFLDATRRDARKRTGSYARHIKVKLSYESATEKRKTWYVAAPEFRKAHLLEEKHRTRDGGYTRAFPHIKENAEKMQKDYERRVREVIDNASR